jgi:hypothetical protein
LFNELNNLAARQPQLPSSGADIGRWQDEPLHRIDPNQPRIEESRISGATKATDELLVEDREGELQFTEKAVKLVSDAFEHALKEKDERIRMLEQANKELGERLAELRTLVRVLEDKFHVRY